MLDANALELLLGFTLIELVIGLVFVLWIGPRRAAAAARRLVHEDLVGDEEHAGLVDAVFIPKVREELQATVAEGIMPAVREELQSLVDKVLLPRMREELQAVVRAADARIEAAQQQMAARMAAVQQQLAAAAASESSGEMSASEMGKASGSKRTEYAIREENLEAHIRQFSPGLAPVIISVSKGMFGKLWKETVRIGPEGIPALLAQVKDFVGMAPAPANGIQKAKASGSEPAWWGGGGGAR